MYSFLVTTVRDPYVVLGVSRGASSEEIKAAYRRLALQYHPDRNAGDKRAEERFKEISEAYATLRDPELRARYDHFGASRPEAARPDFSRVDWQAIFQEADIHIDLGRGGIPRTGNVVFDALFGMMAAGLRNSGLLPGEARAVSVEISVEEARTGSVRRVHVPGPSVCPQCRGESSPLGCSLCDGQGVVRRGATVEVRIPKGVRPGTRLRLRGLGGPGNPPGDAFVTVQVRLPVGARLEGRDLHAELPITALEAEKGTQSRILGLTVKVPAKAKDGQVIRIPGGGLSGGDLWVKLKVAVWPGLWRKLRDALT